MYSNPIRTYIFLLLKDGKYTVGSGYHRVELQFEGGLEEAVRKARQEKKKIHTKLPQDFPETWQDHDIISLHKEFLPMPPGQDIPYLQYFEKLLRDR